MQFGLRYHVEPNDAPVVGWLIGNPDKIVELLDSRVPSVVLTILEALSFSELQEGLAALERKIEAKLRSEFKSLRVATDFFSFGEIAAK